MPTPDYGLLDRAGAPGFLFYPRPDPSPPPTGARDLAIQVAPGLSLGARFYEADPALPVILYFHGNGEVASDHDGIAPMYHQAGANLLVVEFRGYGRSAGHPRFATLVEDCGPVVAAFHGELDAAGYTAPRYVMGRSMGAHPALEIAANHAARFHGLIIESGAGNLRRLVAMLGIDGESGPGHELAAAHDAKIASISLPALILHGEWDELIPLENAAWLHDQLGSADKQLVVIPQAGHNDILWVGRRQYFEAIAAFLTAQG